MRANFRVRGLRPAPPGLGLARRLRAEPRGLRSVVLVLLLAAVQALLGSSPAGATECGCGAPTCAQVSVDADNSVDFNCKSSLVGQTLPDSDGDGNPDACDLCPCVANPIDEETGRVPECPLTTAPAPPPVDPPLPRIRCVDGEVAGIPANATVWLLRPRALAFTRFEAHTHQLAAGAHLLMLRNLNVDSCETIDVGGIASVKRLPPKWHVRAGLFASVAANITELDLDAALGVDGGVDYRFLTTGWELGPSLHVMTLVGSVDPIPLYIGLGPRVGLFDFVALTPFIQADVRQAAQLSYGLWLTFDIGALEDIGVELDSLTGRVP